MATRRLNYPIEPIDLANMRTNGGRIAADLLHKLPT
jgi:hypothetical protein